jgi:RHS repeat-associated protein
VLTILKTPSVTKWTWSGAGYVRESPGEKQLAATDRRQVYKRARYYDPGTGDFISRDPLEYVDGMSLYRAYLVLGGVDPYGEAMFRKFQEEEIPGNPFSGNGNKPGPKTRRKPAISGKTTNFSGLFGVAFCDLSDPVGAPYDIIIFTKIECIKPCVLLHEKEHEKDALPCCNKARAAFQAAKNKRQESDVLLKWLGYINSLRPFSECRAYKVSLKCANDEFSKNGCGCKTSACCDHLFDLIGSQTRQVNFYCELAKGAEPKCPAF